jgi:hypothetical protein
MNPPSLIPAHECGKSCVLYIIITLTFEEKPSKLMISGDCWAPDLDDVHIITGKAGLSKPGHHLAGKTLLGTTEMMKFRDLLICVLFGAHLCVHDPTVPERGTCAFPIR